MDWSDRLGKRIKLRDLHILQAAVEAGSMAATAPWVAFVSLAFLASSRTQAASMGAAGAAADRG